MISYYCYIITIALSRIVFHIYTVSTKKKQRQRIFILFRTDKFDKIWRKYSLVYSGHSCSCIFNEACVILLPEMFYFNDVLAKLKQRLLVECRKLDHSTVVVAISQWCCRLSACVRAHGGHFEQILWCFHGSVTQCA